MVDFTIEEENREFFDKVISRALMLNPEADPMNLEMDISATHANGTPLDFEKLFSFDEFSFQHDMVGISRNLNRETGELLNHFLPRCSK